MDAFTGENLTYQFGDFELESGRRVLRARSTGTVVSLTGRAFDLLLFLVRRPNVLVTKDELMSALWPDTVVEDNNLDNAVFALRQALGEKRGEHRYVKTIHRRGYQFTVAVSVVQPASVPVVPDPALAAQPQPSRRRAAWGVAVTLLVVAAVSSWLVARHFAGTSTAQVAAPVMSATHDRFAVLNFAGPEDEGGALLRDIVTRLLYERFSAIPALTMLGNGWGSGADAMNLTDLGRKMNARYLLYGSVKKSGDQLHLEVGLRDADTAADLWSHAYDRPVADLTAIREDIAGRVTAALHVDPRVTDEAARLPVTFELYQLYCRANQLIGADATIEEMERAAALFARTTTLDPRFARGYLGVAEALLFASSSKPGVTGGLDPGVVARARHALDRALELNPALAEALVARARLIDDPAEAERQFKQGLRLAPNYSVGSLHYSHFLYDRDRKGEALAVLARARELDPLAVWLYVFEADMLMMSRSDVEGSERLLRQALGIDPDYLGAHRALALSLQFSRGEFAQAIRMLEQRVDSENGNRAELATVYLDVDDPEAAVEVWNNSKVPPPFQLILISQYRHDLRGAARVARSAVTGKLAFLYERAAESIRDEAVATGDYAAALSALEPLYAAHPWSGTDANADRGFAIVYAHTLILAGQVARGRELARALLASVDADEVGRPPHWFGRERAALFVLLGEPDQAIAELGASQKLNQWAKWWYTGELDPLFAPLHADARFQALTEDARRQRAIQRALVDEMRRRGEIPRRGGRRAAPAAAG
ncbi:MAG TPA: winged helix-turn-helix domain-containing protein [Steroidobacteraceae bacterium]|nr:winged helix-turn-helix domain-containing protein [Steroidobacteraceae bacterium]